MSRIKNIKDLRNDLLKKYEETKTTKEVEKLTTFTATASAIIRSAKTELDYNKYRENKKEIEFLKVDDNE